MLISKNISFEVGVAVVCRKIFAQNDGECELPQCNFEHFFSHLNTTDYNVRLEPSKTTIYIKEDLQNCSKFLVCSSDLCECDMSTLQVIFSLTMDVHLSLLLHHLLLLVHNRMTVILCCISAFLFQLDFFQFLQYLSSLLLLLLL